jgi:hypothetical protein
MFSIALGVYLGLISYHPVASDCRSAAALPPAIDTQLHCDPKIPLDEQLVVAVDPKEVGIQSGSIAYRRAGTNATRRLRFDYYPAVSERTVCPAIIINPISGGNYELERVIARDLIRHGYHTIVVFRPPPAEVDWLGGDFQSLEGELRSSVASRRRLVDWLETRPEIDTTRIGVHGTSLGGILTVLHAAADRRIAASVVLMAGGGLPELLCRSTEPEPRRFARAHGVPPAASADDLAAFEKLARPVLKTDPCLLAKFIEPSSIFMAITRRDQSVPSELQWRLHEALGRPTALSLPSGHYSAAIYLPLIQAQARSFFHQRFSRRHAK